ncbi:flagellar basal body L-ring protein FlgH, partial [Desulfovibrio litoralis]
MKTKKHTQLTKGLSVLTLLSLCGCNAAHQSPTPMPPVTPAQVYTEPEQRYNNPGSMFSESGGDGLFADNRARRIGDIVLVKLVEQTKAKNKSDTSSNKESDSNFGIGALFGAGSSSFIPGFSIGDRFSGRVGPNAMVSANSASDFSATGETKSENYVTTVLAVRILNVMPNGLLQLEGAREVKVNAETQYMVVTGMARSNDVASDNSILS